LEKDADGKPLPVVYPHAENPQISDTDKGYQWFVNNNVPTTKTINICNQSPLGRMRLYPAYR
jgi:hypothetical protein